MNYLLPVVVIGLGLVINYASKHHLYPEPEHFLKLRKYKNMIKSHFLVKQYCRHIGGNVDFNHFKYEKPVPTEMNCRHDDNLNVNFVNDHHSFLIISLK